MVGQNLENSNEELSFGKVGKNASEQEYSQEYALFHLKKGPSRKGRDWVGISYKDLKFYLGGASLGKSSQIEKFYLFNGISEATKDGMYKDVEFLPLEESELFKLIEEADIPDKLKIKTIF
jgi:hypothetical protein